ncbi:phosphate ABC transporter permease subunit PstC [Spongiibacter sp. KMU-158]|uniref:Phosphate transport system permease protein n=1 Tax=Spongiibacter pelagi TaxID=2760804 RepID=A0A927GWI3_9GAMM|nr:phosphate ABC transporter permease subunit PstC [Spongiibacter pelagi]MBD2859143.1 phosphate ABC transporter permease subunit PstC [Spongiibacter pelagi]
MQASTLFIIIIGLSIFGYFMGQGRALALAKPLGGIRKLHSLPSYYAAQAALFCALPAIVLMGLWLIFEQPIIDSLVMSRVEAGGLIESKADYNLALNRVHNIAAGVLSREGQQSVVLAAADNLNAFRTNARLALTLLALSLSVAGLVLGLRRIRPDFRARASVEWIMSGLLMACALLAIFTTLGILLSVVFESIHFFRSVPISEFIFGTSWSPQTAIRADQVGSSGSFGAVPLFTGTLLISAVAMFVAVPVGLMSAIYLAEYASRRTRTLVKPTLEILAGIPTVVYGFFAALTVAPFIRNLGESLGLDVSSESALAAGSVMGVMIIPFISSLADDVITAVPQSMRDGSLALGATKSETIRKVVVPAALPGIVGGVLLALSRAIGETMIVVMAAGMAANLTANPLDTVTTVTVQIVTLLTGDQEFDSAKTLAAFALGLMLFVVTLCLNIVALRVVKKYREQYE